MRQINIDKFGHQKKIIKYAQQLNQSPQQQYQQQIISPAQPAFLPISKTEIEGSYMHDTAGK